MNVDSALSQSYFHPTSSCSRSTRAQLNFWARVSQESSNANECSLRASPQGFGAFPSNNTNFDSGRDVTFRISFLKDLSPPRAAPGPGVLYGAPQRLQDSQPGFLLGAVADFQVAHDDSLQPLQVPHHQDAQPDATKHKTEEGDTPQG